MAQLVYWTALPLVQRYIFSSLKSFNPIQASFEKLFKWKVRKAKKKGGRHRHDNYLGILFNQTSSLAVLEFGMNLNINSLTLEQELGNVRNENTIKTGKAYLDSLFDIL